MLIHMMWIHHRFPFPVGVLFKSEQNNADMLDILKVHQRRRYGGGGLGPPTFQIGEAQLPPPHFFSLVCGSPTTVYSSLAQTPQD